MLGFSTQRIDSSSNIAATSTFGAQGIVTVTRLGNDPDRGLQPDPIVPSAPTIEAAQGWKGGNNRTVILTSQPIDNSEPTGKIGSCTSR